MNPKLKKYLEIFIVIGIFYYFIYMFAYVYVLDSYCDKNSQEVNDTKKMNLYILGNCKSNYFCEVSEQKYVLGKLANYKCIKKILNRYEYDFYLNKYEDLIR